MWTRPTIANATLAVEIFDGTGHFGMWQSEVLDALFQQGLDIAIDEEKPDDVQEKDWKAINRLACGTIRSCLSREQRYAFSKETSANKLWVALEENFLKKNSQNKLHLKKRLFRFTYVPSTTMNDHITKFNQLVTDLLNMDETFKDEDLALMLLGSLPEEFEFLETTLLHGRSDISLSEVCAALYSYEQRKKDKQKNSIRDTEALVVRGRSYTRKKTQKGRSKSKSRLGKDECAFCHEKGHWKKNCPKLKNNTWELAQLPKGKRAIGCKWVFAKKDGSPSKKDIRYKARLVAKGYAQKEGIDYNDVFSPVVKHSSIRILLALVAQLNLELAQLDVKTAFLHGELEEEIYMTQPEGYTDAGGRNWVCKLNKSLYGLKQSPRQWYKRFDQFMKGQRYTRSKFDHCVYFQKLQEGTFIYLLLYVDDMLIASKSKVEIERLKTQLNLEFEMKDLGEAKKILGMEICRDRAHGRVSLSQKQYLKKVLQQFGMNEQTKPVSTPLASHFKLSAQLSPSTNTEQEYMLQVPYANAVGSLMYAMVCTRPDISQAVSIVSRYMHNPGKGHWQAVKWILRYILKTVDVGLLFKQDTTLGKCVIGYVDSDYAGDLDKRRSTTGYVFTLAGGPIS